MIYAVKKMAQKSEKKMTFFKSLIFSDKKNEKKNIFYMFLKKKKIKNIFGFPIFLPREKNCVLTYDFRFCVVKSAKLDFFANSCLCAEFLHVFYVL